MLGYTVPSLDRLDPGGLLGSANSDGRKVGGGAGGAGAASLRPFMLRGLYLLACSLASTRLAEDVSVRD